MGALVITVPPVTIEIADGPMNSQWRAAYYDASLDVQRVDTLRSGYLATKALQW